ncbi:DHH family phosphoesterase [Aneurinibacillus uraniidurans]|uniref:DHH family phosphoesterase n=1 Tax=Aneurinibacillus uraniidurans TaxID=2966586 RepID=UPI00234B9AB4|nr:DHH family phosphoesterase [Aneurinibacillus sp. B1]WCN37887.1 DHH family phosphoesterase [Aneurinibacillus sp. B1]
MPKFLAKRWFGSHMILALIFGLMATGLLAFYVHWIFGLLGILGLVLIIYVTLQNKKQFLDEVESYATSLGHRIQHAGDDVIQSMPVGIVLVNDNQSIEWHNQYVQMMTGRTNLIGETLLEVFPPLADVKLGKEKAEITYQKRIYDVEIRSDERLFYFTDITLYKELQMHYEDEKLVMGIVHLDNLDEVVQGMDEQSQSILLTNVTGAITKWAQQYDIYLRRFASDKFFAVLDHGTLQQLEATRFDVLDVVREMTTKNKIPITLSIGIGAGVDGLIELGEMAQSSLDVALGRGGDQAAVKVRDKLTFYGGKSNAVEKRNRVRARVIAHALRDLMLESDLVLIMGHKMPDMDAIGAAIGVLKAVHAADKQGYILLDESNPAIERLMQAVEEHEDLNDYFITSDQAIQMVTQRTLVVVVDTHRPSMTIEPRLLNMTSKVVLIDHHRRSEEFIADPVLIYLEPYASSTSELVTELLQYQGESLSLDVLEATALLAGIVVDTKSFAFRTGSRTFEAASFLRRKGADTALVQILLKEDLTQYIRRAEIVQQTEIIGKNIAIAQGKNDEKYGQLLIAQAADTLLTMAGIDASFVICRRPDDMIGISARSLGDFNVQVVMEEMGGGGHLNNAATQLKEVTVAEAVEQLKQVLKNYQGGKPK